MLQKTPWLLCLCLFFLSCLPASAAAQDPQRYVIGPGDILDISVWKDEAQSKIITVLPDGTIALPLIGEIEAAGKTVGQLKEEVRNKVKRFVADPVLTVIVQQTNSMMIYVIGKVKQPGRFPINTNINVLQALSIAGGLNPFAKRDKIQIMREINGETTIFPFNYDNVSLGKELSQNLTLQRGDIVVVP